jgi:hypothetical protein
MKSSFRSNILETGSGRKSFGNKTKKSGSSNITTTAIRTHETWFINFFIITAGIKEERGYRITPRSSTYQTKKRLHPD